MNGFPGLGATFNADLNLAVQLTMGIALLLGMFLARRKQFRAHMFCQTSVMLLNLVMIFLIMAPSFHRQVSPQIPANLHDPYYAVATLHASLGTIAELLGLYIVLVAATKLLPERWRFQRYKPWMRTELALWWLVVLIGLGTYYVWYLAPAPKVAAQPSPSAQANAPRVTVKVANFAFEPKELTIPAGTIVEWIDETGRHTVEADDGSFKSETLAAGGHFEHKFDRPGIFAYYCNFHGGKGGTDMSGVVRVTAPGAK